MVFVQEIRVVTPFKPDDYDRGSEYTAAKGAMRADEGAQGKDGIEIRKHKSYFDEELQKEGIYTQRVYHLGAVLPSSAVTFYEDCYSCWPKVDTKVTNSFLGDRFIFQIKTRHAEGKGEIHNIHNLTYLSCQIDRETLMRSDEELKKRKVVVVNIAETKKDIEEDVDPTRIVLKHTRSAVPSPLTLDWMDKAKAEDCCTAYKLVTIKLQIWGLQTRLENYAMTFEHDLLKMVAQQCFCWSDEWMDMSNKAILKFVNETRKKMRARHQSAGIEEEGEIEDDSSESVEDKESAEKSETENAQDDATEGSKSEASEKKPSKKKSKKMSKSSSRK